MTHTTEQERAEFEDGAWYWVEKEGWHDEPPEIAPAMYRANSKAWYSYRFGGVPTRELKILGPCLMQAARRAPAAPVPQGWKLVPVELLDRATESLGSFVSDHGWGQADMDTFDDLSALAAAPQPPEAAPVPQGLFEAIEHGDEKHRAWLKAALTEFFAGKPIPREVAAAPQPPEAALVPSIAVTPEMVEAANEAYCPFGDMELALCAALQVAPIPPGAAPVQLPENIREGEAYDNPAFEALARALGVWGTAQSAVCAQFWIAAKEQST